MEGQGAGYLALIPTEALLSAHLCLSSSPPPSLLLNPISPRSPSPSPLTLLHRPRVASQAGDIGGGCHRLVARGERGSLGWRPRGW